MHHTNRQDTADSIASSALSQSVTSSANRTRMPWMAQHNSVNGEHAAAVGMDSPHPLNASAHSTMSAISTSSVQSTNSYARMHQHKVAGHSSASSAASSSYASWARRSKKLKKTASGYAASSTHSSAVSSAAATPKPSRSKGRKIVL